MEEVVLEDKRNTEVKKDEKIERKRDDKKAVKAGGKPSPIRVGILGLLGILTAVSGTFYYNLVLKENPPKVIYQEEEQAREIVREALTIYVPTESGESLESKQVEIVVGDTQEERVKMIFDALKENLAYKISYTDEEGKVVEVPFLSEEVQLMDVYIDGRDIYLNMNYHFRENMKTISQEIFVIYSIVNTLTEDGRYRRVKFLVNDKEVEQLNFYKLSEFYERNLEI